MDYPKSIQNLINELAKLPSIGPKTAERLAFHLLNRPAEIARQLSQALITAKSNARICAVCFNFAENDPCPICADPRRDKSVICVVCKPQEIMAIEKTRSFNGVYHALGGNINPLENVGPENLKIKELLARVQNNGVKEIILAFNPDVGGESTALYLMKLLKQYPLKITRLARGLPMGADLEYADEITLENALKDRKTVE